LTKKKRENIYITFFKKKEIFILAIALKLIISLKLILERIYIFLNCLERKLCYIQNCY